MSIVNLELNILKLNKECIDLKEENELLKMTIENLPLDISRAPKTQAEPEATEEVPKELHHDLVFQNESKSPFIHISNFGKRVAAEGGKGLCRSKTNTNYFKLRVVALTTL